MTILALYNPILNLLKEIYSAESTQLHELNQKETSSVKALTQSLDLNSSSKTIFFNREYRFDTL